MDARTFNLLLELVGTRHVGCCFTFISYYVKKDQHYVKTTYDLYDLLVCVTAICVRTEILRSFTSWGHGKMGCVKVFSSLFQRQMLVFRNNDQTRMFPSEAQLLGGSLHLF